MRSRAEIAKSNAAVDAVVVSQPAWLQIDKITDGIDSYASFEDQAGKLRWYASAIWAIWITVN